SAAAARTTTSSASHSHDGTPPAASGTGAGANDGVGSGLGVATGSSVTMGDGLGEGSGGLATVTSMTPSMGWPSAETTRHAICAGPSARRGSSALSVGGSGYIPASVNTAPDASVTDNSVPTSMSASLNTSVTVDGVAMV